MTATEFDLLTALSTEAGRVVPHDRLLRRVWSPGKPGNLRLLRTHLMHLRRKLGEDGENPRYILVEPRVGYWMPEGEVEQVPVLTVAGLASAMERRQSHFTQCGE